MKKVGVVGGIGPASTLDYYKGIIDGYQARTASDTCPPIVIDSLNLAEMYALASNKTWDTFAERLVDSLHTLKAGGAQFAVMAANTAHIVFDDVRTRSPLPLISIVEETCKLKQAKGCQRVIVFGTAFTMSSGLFTEAFAKYGIEAFVPNEADQATIHGIIFPNLQAGIVLPEEKHAMLEIANRMIAEKQADALILGCTELPMIIKPADLGVALLDTTQIHIEAVLDQMLA